MATISYNLDTRRPRKDGTYPLRLRVCHRNSCFYISSGISLEKSQWDSKTQKVIGHKNSDRLNLYISKERLRVEDILIGLKSSGELDGMSLDELRERIEGKKKSPPTIFRDYAEYFASTRKRPKTREHYANTLAAIAKFANLEKLRFEDITFQWLRDFDVFLTDRGLAVNSSAGILRDIRAIFNDAINTGNIGQELYPFRKFKIKHEKTRKRSMTIEQLRELRDYPCKESQEKWRDAFLLSFYLIGINNVDLLGLKSIDNGRIEYRRSKTGRLYSIKLEPEALAIIEKYRGKEYLLSLGDQYHEKPGDFTRYANKALRKIGPCEMIANRSEKNPKRNKEKVTPIVAGISSYWARHTWASIAASLDIPKETIAAALGHEIGSEVTGIYIDFDQRKIDEANRRVIDYLNDKKAPAD